MLKKTKICIGFVCLHIMYLSYTSSQKYFGPFNYRVSSFVKCKGPKRYDCCNTTVKVDSGRKLLIIMDVHSKLIPNRGKIIISVNGKVLVRLQIKKPCDQIFLKPLVYSYLNATQECEIPKGLYNMSFDSEKLSQDFYGGKFFYGNLTVKSVLYNDNYNFLCTIIEAVLSPQDKP